MLKKLKEKLYNEIPLTKYMQINPKSIDEEFLITQAPLKPNINDKGTGFAGSLSTLVTISAWCSCYLTASKLGFKNTMIAIVKNNISYNLPITKDMTCYAEIPNKDQIKIFQNKLKEKGSASLKIKATIIEDKKNCVEFEGIYVVKIKNNCNF